MIKYCLIPLLAAVCYGGFAQDKQKMIDSASNCITAKNYGRAINIYNKLLTEDSLDANLFELRADAYVDMQDLESAGRDYTYAIKLSPLKFYPYAKRGDVFVEMGYFEYAIKDYSAALRVANADSIKSNLLVSIAMTKRRMNDYEGMEKDLRKSLDYDSTNLAALANIGPALSQNGKPQEAIVFLERAIRLDPDFEGGYGNLAFIYNQMGDYKKAVETNNKLLAKHPNEPYALNNRGYAKLKLNDIEGALEDINNSIQLSPKNSYAYKNRGEVYLALKKIKEACSDFQRSLQLGFTELYGNEVQRLVDKHCSTSKPKTTIQ